MRTLGAAAIGAIVVLALQMIADASWLEIVIIGGIAAAAIAVCLRIVAAGAAGPPKRDD